MLRTLARLRLEQQYDLPAIAALGGPFWGSERLDREPAEVVLRERRRVAFPRPCLLLAPPYV